MPVSTADLAALARLLDQALEVDPSRREAWFDGIAQAEQHLVPKLRTMLAARDQPAAGRFLEALPLLHDEPAVDDHGVARAGERVGPYRLIREIGHGGMGSVWLAERADGAYTREVALKLPRLTWAPGLAKRMARERDIGARLEHPNIARLYDAGVDEQGRPYMAMEYIDGKPIDVWCRERQLRVRQKLELIAQVARAVAYAHGRLVVHRDIKPSNVLVSGDGRVHLLDFGIAMLLDEEQAGQTQEAGRPMTPRYASPEQLKGEAATVQSDVYGIGVLVYELLTGSVPRGNAPNVIERAILDEVLPAPSRRVVEKAVAASLRGDIDAIVAKSLEPDLARRYPSAEALAVDIERYLAGDPVSARAGSALYRIAKFARRHSIGAAAAGITAVAVVVGLAGTMWQAQRAQRERDLAVEQLVYSEAVEEFLSFLLSSTANKPFQTEELLDRGQDFAARQFASDPGVQARLLLVLEGLYSHVTAHDKQARLIEQSRQLARQAGQRELQARAECRYAYEIEQDPRRAEIVYNEAIAELNARGPMAATALADCLLDRGQRALDSGDLDAATRDQRAALAALAEPRPGARALALRVRAQLAGTLARRGDLAAALKEYQSVIEGLEAMGRGRTTEASIDFNNLGVLQFMAGHPLQAIASMDRVLEATGNDDKALPNSLNGNRAAALLAVGRRDDAVAAFQRAVRLAQEGGDDRAYAHAVMSFSHCELAESQACDSRLAKARELLRAMFTEGHANFGLVELTAAHLALQRSDVQLAKTRLVEATSVFEASGRRPNLIRSLALLARVELMLGDGSAALTSAVRAVEHARALIGNLPYSEWLGQALLSEGSVRMAQGDVATARMLLREALSNLEPTAGSLADATVEVNRLLRL